MQSTTSDLIHDISSFSSVDEDNISISSFSNISTAVAASSYTSNQLILFRTILIFCLTKVSSGSISELKGINGKAVLMLICAISILRTLVV